MGHAHHHHVDPGAGDRRVALAVGVNLALTVAQIVGAALAGSLSLIADALHNLSDALGSVAVIVAGTLIMLFDWWIVDPLVTLGIAGYILWLSFAEIGPVIRMLMLGSPPETDAHAVVAAMGAVDGVDDVHRVHLWQLDEHRDTLDAHLAIASGDWQRADAIKAAVRERLRTGFGIEHATLETECARHACGDAATFGHGDVVARHAHGDEHRRDACPAAAGRRSPSDDGRRSS